MDKQVYYFLNEFLGHDVRCIHLTHTHIPKQAYLIKSVKGGFGIFEFTVLDEKIVMFRCKKICEILSAFFGIDEKKSSYYIKNWFADIHGIQKVKDILKFIDSYSIY
jgi:hypothetical protein